MAAEQGIENVRASRGDVRDVVERLPDAVAVVSLANAFHSIDDPESFAAGVRRTLAPNGRCILVNWYLATRNETLVWHRPTYEEDDGRSVL